MSEQEKSIVDIDSKVGSIEVGLDSDKDGQSSLSVEIDYSEGVSELLLGKLKGGKISFNGNASFVDGKVIFGIDLDGDGENLITFKLDIEESLDEATQAIKK